VADNTNSNVSRRQVLKNISAAGGLYLASTGTSATEVIDDSVQIVTHQSAEGPKKTKQVPASWLQHYQNVRRVRDNLINEYINRNEVVEIGITGSDRQFDGKGGFDIQVKVDPSMPVDLPSVIQGINIQTKEAIVRTPHCGDGCYNTGDYVDTPGGVDFDGGTSGCQYWLDTDNDGYYEKKTMLTSNHLFGQCNDNDGEEVYQNGNKWGVVSDHSELLDIACCEPNSSHTVENQIVTSDESYTVSGFVTENGIADMEADERLIAKMGKMTGETYGTISKHGNYRGDYECVNWGGEGVRASFDSTCGDSGGPWYDIDGSDAYIIGINWGGGDPTGRYDCENQEIDSSIDATSGYVINDVFNGAFIKPI